MSLRLLALTCSIFLSQGSLVPRSSTVTDSPDSVCGQGANPSCLIDKAQKRTPPEVILEPIGLVIAPQEQAPAQLVPPTSHGFDLLTAATLKNRSKKTIISYRIGWAFILQNGIEFHTGALGRTHNVPGQGIHLAPGAEQVIFFVAELTFANGDHWTAKKKDL